MMRYIPAIALFIASCTKAPQGKPVPEKVNDDFGMKTFNTVPRPAQTFPLQHLSWTKPVATANSTPINVILLDFDGYEFDNTNYNTSGVITAGYSGLTPTEQQRVLDSVKKDFKYLYCTITADEGLYNRCDPTRRQRLVITESYQWYGMAGGVSYVNSFTWGNDTPAFVFSMLLNYDLKSIQEAVSHEIGHTLGLHHQSKWVNGEKVSEYNYGTEEKAPIMGCAYFAKRGEWNIGLDAFGNVQYDGRLMEQKLGGKYDGQGNFKPYGSY